ncbi:MAG: hypothetical protein ACKVX7_19330 [Planctomycetota bacterium]
MAVRALCDKCHKSFSAQDEYLGRRIKCPSCGAKVKVLSPDELRAERHRRRAQKAWQEEQEQRIELIEMRDRQRRGDGALTALGTGPDPVRNYNPGAISRFRRLRVLSSFLLFSAYFLVGLGIAGAGISLHLFRDGTIASLSVLVLVELGWLLGMLLMFALLKFSGEISWLLADLGDHQIDVRNLLLDIREDFDREAERQALATHDPGVRDPLPRTGAAQ